VWFWKFESRGFGKFWKSFGNSHGILYEPWIVPFSISLFLKIAFASKFDRISRATKSKKENFNEIISYLLR
jgi:hypothetical protein